MKELFGDKGIASYEGKDRRLFASAITPKGLVNYLHTLINTDRAYILKGMQGQVHRGYFKNLRRQLWREGSM